MESENEISLSTGKVGGRWSRLGILWPWTLALVAWLALFMATLTNQLVLFDHDYLLNSGHLPWLLALAVFLLMWQVMTLAMMLPSTLPTLFLLVPERGRGGWKMQAIFLLVYAAVWTIFGVLAFLGDTCVHWLVNHWEWLYQHAEVITLVLFALAGGFQLCRFKRRCLLGCGAHLSLCKGSGLRTAGALGWRYSWYCVGSCWALMLVTFGLGGKNLLAMALVALVILLEKGLPEVRIFRFVVGGAFLLLALLWAALL
ncbi:DUF2182 domain-containing protein [Ktedonosporobacter rubrisoli]|uniref:DUF2182 domain-containing protein n=1 Tax=Ktedonosporobacter rubrisoli TaxID=2509675 RepID=A0A4P6JVM5_KTERU|nr:DUF2182 domain-containing protein [Ktedonosporobacter rubrisoli]QBD79016.1 DUF2182 domain-containing protein [Ktedonosporobacter rubrisoli]